MTLTSGWRIALQIALGQPRAVVPAVIVQRGEHDVELGQHVVVEVERAVRHDVDFDAVEDLDAR